MVVRLAGWGHRLRAHFEDERGANLTEYGIVVVLIAVVTIAGIVLVGDQTTSNISGVASSL